MTQHSPTWIDKMDRADGHPPHGASQRGRLDSDSAPPPVTSDWPASRMPSSDLDDASASGSERCPRLSRADRGCPHLHVQPSASPSITSSAHMHPLSLHHHTSPYATLRHTLQPPRRIASQCADDSDLCALPLVRQTPWSCALGEYPGRAASEHSSWVINTYDTAGLRPCLLVPAAVEKGTL